MNDRFRFNAIVTVEYYENYENYENDEESKLQIYLRNIDLMDANTIGYRNDKISYILKNAGLSDYALHNAMERIEENSVSAEPSEWITLVPDVILQCTGLKDKNSTLIYEGDIVEVQYIGAQISLFQNTYEQEPQPERFAIIYDYNWHKFTCKNKYYRNTCEIHSLDIEKIIINPENKRYEVIGNIYENPELLKGQND